MPTIFTRIIDGELPGHFVWRDDRCVAFLSINPLGPGPSGTDPEGETQCAFAPVMRSWPR